MGVVFSGYVTGKTEEVELSRVGEQEQHRPWAEPAAAGSAAASALFSVCEFPFPSHPLVNY